VQRGKRGGKRLAGSNYVTHARKGAERLELWTLLVLPKNAKEELLVVAQARFVVKVCRGLSHYAIIEP
jgi:hypothetical protein